MSEETTKVDLSGLTADQLLAMSKEEWDEFYAVVKAALQAKAEEEKAEFKAKLAIVIDKVKALDPVIKYVVGAAILLRVFGVI